MGRSEVDSAALASIPRLSSVDTQIRALAEEILRDAQSKAPVATGALKASGFVDGTDSEYRIGFDKDYAADVEAGTEDTAPHPYLAPAALHDRGPL